MFCAYAQSVSRKPTLRFKLANHLLLARANHRYIGFLLTTFYRTAKKTGLNLSFLLVGGGGFEPPKSETSDLQSDAFGHSAIRPYLVFYPVCGGVKYGAGDWNRTHNLLITNQLLCQLSYTSKPLYSGALGWNRTADIWIFSPPLYRLSYQGVCTFKRCDN